MPTLPKNDPPPVRKIRTGGDRIESSDAQTGLSIKADAGNPITSAKLCGGGCLVAMPDGKGRGPLTSNGEASGPRPPALSRCRHRFGEIDPFLVDSLEQRMAGRRTDSCNVHRPGLDRRRTEPNLPGPSDHGQTPLGPKSCAIRTTRHRSPESPWRVIFLPITFPPAMRARGSRCFLSGVNVRFRGIE